MTHPRLYGTKFPPNKYRATSVRFPPQSVEVSPATIFTWSPANKADWDAGSFDGNMETVSSPGDLKLGRFDGFEDNDLSEYGGVTGNFGTQSDRVNTGSFGVEKTVDSGNRDVIYFDNYSDSNIAYVEVWGFMWGTGNEFGPAVFDSTNEEGYAALMTEGGSNKFLLLKMDTTSSVQATLDSDGDASSSFFDKQWWRATLKYDPGTGDLEAWVDQGAGTTKRKTLTATDTAFSPDTSAVVAEVA